MYVPVHLFLDQNVVSKMLDGYTLTDMVVKGIGYDFLNTPQLQAII